MREEAGLQQGGLAETGEAEENHQPLAENQAQQILRFGLSPLEIALVGFAKGEQSWPWIVRVDGGDTRRNRNSVHAQAAPARASWRFR